MYNTNDKTNQNSIYIPYDGVRVAVDKELHDAFYKTFNELRRYKHSLGECACLEREYYKCDGNCEKCGFRRGKNGPMDWIREKYEVISLDEDEMVDTTQDLAAIVERKDCYEHLYRAMATLSDRERKICEMIANGKSIAQIAREFGISKATAQYQRDKVLKKLYKILKGWR